MKIRSLKNIKISTFFKNNNTFLGFSEKVCYNDAEYTNFLKNISKNYCNK